ncbi:MAG: YfhO family protein [Candidatus Kapabacteria bacterium]|nr:YfhO family protein [Candidatus Kapabacteria bacterium]
MVKELKKQNSSDKTATKTIIPVKYLDMIFIGLLVTAVFIFFSGAIFKGGFNASDNISSLSFVKYLEKASADGTFPQWVPHLFGGMPGFSALLVTGDRWYDILISIFFGFAKFIGTIFSNDTARMAFYYALYATGVYTLMRFKKHQSFVSFFSAFAATFSTWVVTWIMIGHNTKPIVFAMYPFVFLFIEKMKVKFSVLYVFLLVLALHIMMEAGHLQMIYYSIFAFVIYYIFEIINTLVKKEKIFNVIRSGLTLAVAAGIAFAMSADRYLSTLEYTPYSTRGSAPIMQTQNQHQDASGGNDYNYATMWSYSPSELLTTVVPSFYGYGIQDFKNEQKTSTYWGTKESEDSPPYMGIIVLGLAILGFCIYRKDPFVQALFVIAIFGIFLSFGKNLSFIFDIVYKIAPNFNKFRAPSMALALMHFAVPLLAGYGISSILKIRKEGSESEKKILKVWIIGGFVFLVAGIIFIAGFQDSYIKSVDQSNFATQIYKEYGNDAQVKTFIEEIAKFNWSGTSSDWMINGLFTVIVSLITYFFVKNKLNKTIFFSILALIVLLDLWRVDYRRMEVAKKSIDKEVFLSVQNIYKPIQAEQDTSVFRIFDMLSQSQNVPAYYLLENVNGYHSAKLRVYQDLLDNANNDNYAGSTTYLYNPFLWNLMNVKYIISADRKRQQPVIYPNADCLPRAFFVKNAVVASQTDILAHLKKGDFSPLDTAFVEIQLPVILDTNIAISSAKIIEHKNESIKIGTVTNGNTLLFISEIYYPPCWKAYIDGSETAIYKTNFAFRSVIVPQGSHTVEMKYYSEKYQTGKTLSLIANILTVLGLGFGIYLNYKEKSGKK